VAFFVPNAVVLLGAGIVLLAILVMAPWRL
jgi:hypothetical protein